jgi:hypothetical protein
MMNTAGCRVWLAPERLVEHHGKPHTRPVKLQANILDRRRFDIPGIEE